jgi:acetyltransferase-like isoleucine patch superfamily enzyme
MMKVRRIIKYIANIATPIETSQSLQKWELKNRILRFARIKIGVGVAISPDFTCITGQEEKLHISDYVSIGHKFTVYNFNDVCIGAFTTIAGSVCVANGWHDIYSLEPRSGPLYIGRGCWIGTGSRIIGSVTIGDNVIIGAGSLVIRDVPNNAIVVGVPARVIKYRILPNKIWHLSGYFNPETFLKV